MKRIFVVRRNLSLWLPCFLLAQAWGQTFEPKDTVMGDYEGVWSTADGQKGLAVAQIRALADNAYEGFVRFERGRKAVAVFRLAMTGPGSPDSINLAGKTIPNPKGGELLPTIEAKAQIKEGQLTGTVGGDFGAGKFEAKRFLKESPTAGANPPPGAVVMFDGKDTSRWVNFNWKLIADGAMETQTGNLNTRERFDDFRMHLEFRVPFLPKETGQARGNSGVYLQSIYEVQVLDSFGVWPLEMGDCSGLFGTREPAQNACLPPGRWQTYDIIYRSKSEGGTKQPVVTVIHNGVTVIDQARIPAAQIGKGGGGGNPEGGFLMLQDHHNPVQFRNIWVLPLKD